MVSFSFFVLYIYMMATFNPHSLCFHVCSRNTLVNLIHIFLPPCTDANSHAFFLGSSEKPLNNGLFNVGEQVFLSLPCYDFHFFYILPCSRENLYLFAIVTFCKFIIFDLCFMDGRLSGTRRDLKHNHTSHLSTLFRA